MTVTSASPDLTTVLMPTLTNNQTDSPSTLISRCTTAKHAKTGTISMMRCISAENALLRTADCALGTELVMFAKKATLCSWTENLVSSLLRTVKSLSISSLQDLLKTMRREDMSVELVRLGLLLTLIQPNAITAQRLSMTA